MLRWAARAVALALALASAPRDAALAAERRGDPGGTYRMRGSARVDAVAPLGRSIEARGDAIVRAAGAGLRVRLASQGRACELVASRGADGGLAFAPGQRCAFDLDDADARGHVEARLRAGSGRLRDRHLSLELAFELSGAVALRTVGQGQVLGIEIPAAWTPELPVDGTASVRAEGDRDESRAAGR